MNLFLNLVTVFKGLAEIGPKSLHAVQQVPGTVKLDTVLLEKVFIKRPKHVYLVGGAVFAVFDDGNL